MKYLKYFEFKKQFREVDLQLLLDDYFDFDKNSYFNNICEKFKKILEPMLLDKEIDYYAFFGRVKSIRLFMRNDYISVILKFYNSGNEEFIITLSLLAKNNRMDKTRIVKIYNSKKTEIEHQIELDKDMKKYNL